MTERIFNKATLDEALESAASADHDASVRMAEAMFEEFKATGEWVDDICGDQGYLDAVIVDGQFDFIEIAKRVRHGMAERSVLEAFAAGVTKAQADAKPR